MPYHVNGDLAGGLADPVLKDGTTYVPIADLVNMLGGYVDWNHDEKSAKIEIGDRIGTIALGSDQAEVNGDTVEMKAMPYIEADVLWAPVRVLRDGWGIKLEVQGDNVSASRF